jgi:peptide/nickel transport system permease protein
MRFMDVMLAIPNVLLAIVIASVLGSGMGNLMIAIGISSVPSFARIVRASILSIRDQEYVEAARLCGCSDFRIITRHILPNIVAPIIVQTTLSLGLAILSASALSYLGLGVQAPKPEWGTMLAAGRNYMRNYWHLVVFPGLAIVLVVLSLNMFGDGLRDALDPRMKS